jgi:hypothetical protein
MVRQPEETITGLVEAVNDRGLKLAGRWYNYSKHRPLPRVAPAVGEAVTLHAEGDWINRLTRAGAAPAAPPAGDEWALGDPLPPPAPAPAPRDTRPLAPAGQPPDKDRQIARMAALKAAVDLIASYPDASREPEAVILVAEQLEAWITRAAR